MIKKTTHDYYKESDITKLRISKSDHYKAVAAATRDIKPIPWGSINWKRRNATVEDPELFAATYMPRVFSMPMADYHHEIFSDGKRIILEGGKKAASAPRGGGKTAQSRALILWGTAHGHIRFPFFIGSTQPKSQQTLDSIKQHWYANKLLRTDYPEIAWAFYRLERSAVRAAMQTHDGQETYVVWGKDELRYPIIVLPAPIVKLMPKANLIDVSEELEIKKSYITRSAGCLIRANGVDGSIRGEADIHPITLEQPRPDFVLFDDIQKDQKAESPTGVRKLIRLIDGAVMGLSSPGVLLSALMICTVSTSEDTSDHYLSKAEWNGTRIKMVTSWPPGMTDNSVSDETEASRLWNEYAAVRLRSLRSPKKNISAATAFYKKHRRIMDEGFTVSWVDRFNKNKKYKGNRELSAQQHAMNLRLENLSTFASEYQNRPLVVLDRDVPIITAGQLAEKKTAVKRFEIEAGNDILVASVDVQSEIFFYCIFSCNRAFDGTIIHYGTWPEINIPIYTKSQIAEWSPLSRAYYEAHPSEPRQYLQSASGKKRRLRAPEEQKLYWGVEQVIKHLRSLPIKAQIDEIGIDCRYHGDDIKKSIRDKKLRGVTPYYGQGIGAKKRQYEDWERRQWVMCESDVHPSISEIKWILRMDNRFRMPYMLADVNRLKTFGIERLGTHYGSNGCVSLFDASPEEHDLFSTHVASSEYPVKVEARGIIKEEWEPHVARDNDWLDTFAACMAFASKRGAALRVMSAMTNKARPARRRKMSAIHAGKR